VADSLVTVHLDTAGGFRRGRVISPENLLNLPNVIRNNLAEGMKSFGSDMIANLIQGYVRAIRVRPRIEGEHLLERLKSAMTMSVNTPQREVWIGVFELSVIDKLTRNEGQETEQQGWFINLEDGHGDEQKHGSKDFYFIELDYAVLLAEEAADEMHLEAGDRAKFVADVNDRFKGRHGEGIMIKLDEPLFWEYPQFGALPGNNGRGKARNIVGNRGHPGYAALDVLDEVGLKSRQAMKDIGYSAVNEAAKSL
jgi:hypothetical protein